MGKAINNAIIRVTIKDVGIESSLRKLLNDAMKGVSKHAKVRSEATSTASVLASQIKNGHLAKYKKKALADIGETVRTKFVSSIKERPLKSTPSAPGQIPMSPTGRLKNKIAYTVEGTESVVIGPTYQYPRTETPASINTKPVTVVKRRLVDVLASKSEYRERIQIIEGKLRTRSSGKRRQLSEDQMKAMIRRKEAAGGDERRRYIIAPELSGRELFQKKVNVRVAQRPFTDPVLVKSVDGIKKVLTKSMK